MCTIPQTCLHQYMCLLTCTFNVPSPVNVHLKHQQTFESSLTMRSSSSAFSSSAPAKTRTKFVPSPHSCSCCCAASTSILAAGCCTSSSFKMVAASLVTNSFSRWLITILFWPKADQSHWLSKIQWSYYLILSLVFTKIYKYVLSLKKAKKEKTVCNNSKLSYSTQNMLKNTSLLCWQWWTEHNLKHLLIALFSFFYAQLDMIFWTVIPLVHKNTSHAHRVKKADLYTTSLTLSLWLVSNDYTFKKALKETKGRGSAWRGECSKWWKLEGEWAKKTAG